MKGINRGASVFALFICCTILTGCWSYNEVNDRLIAISAGIDYSEINTKYTVTIKAINAKPAQEGVEIIPEVISVDAESVFEAIRKAAPLFAKKTYWSHMKTLIVNENVASRDLLLSLDFFNRDPEVRQDFNIYITAGKSAEEIIRLEEILQRKRNYSFGDAIKTQEFVGSFPSIDFHEFTQRVIESTVDPLVPLVGLHTNGEFSPKLEGSAVFRGGRMIGKLDSKDTLFALLIRDDVINPLIPITINEKTSSKNNQTVTLEIYNSKSKIKANTSNGNISIIINIEIDAGISEINKPLDFTKKENVDAIKTMGTKEIKSRIIGTIKTVQDSYKSDVFGFGKAVQISDAKAWKKLKKDWPDKFETLPVDINLKLNITNTGKITKSFKGDE